MFEKVHPAGTAGGQQRNPHIGITCQIPFDPVQQLRSLLHDGEVCTEVGIENVVEPQATEGGHQLAGNQGSRLHAKLLSQRCTHGRSSLHHYRLLRIGECLKHLITVIHFGKRTRRAYRDTLSTVGAGRFFQIHLEGRCHHRHKSPVDCRECPYGLHVVTDHLTAPAQYTFVHIPDDGGGGIFPVTRLFTGVWETPDTELRSQVLQFALPRFGADQTIERMIRNDQLKHCLARVKHSDVMCAYHHPLLYLGHTRRSKVPAAFHLYHTDPASLWPVFDSHVAHLEME